MLFSNTKKSSTEPQRIMVPTADFDFSSPQSQFYWAINRVWLYSAQLMSIPISSSPCFPREIGICICHAADVLVVRGVVPKSDPDFPYPTSNRFGDRKDAPLTLLPVVAVSSAVIMLVSAATVFLPTHWPVLFMFRFPQEESEEDEETEEDEEDEEECVLPEATAMDVWFVPIIEFIPPSPLPTAFNPLVPVDRFDTAACIKKSNSSPKPVIGDHWFHSIVLPPNMERVDTNPWLSFLDWERASWVSVIKVEPRGCSLMTMLSRARPSTRVTTGGLCGYMRGIWIMTLHR